MDKEKLKMISEFYWELKDLTEAEEAVQFFNSLGLEWKSGTPITVETFESKISEGITSYIIKSTEIRGFVLCTSSWKYEDTITWEEFKRKYIECNSVSLLEYLTV